MSKSFILITLFFLITSIFAQKNTRKGLAALEVHNYGIAATYFKKDNEKAPVAANYGWAKYYQTVLFFNADSAYAYLNSFESQFHAADSTTRLKLQKDLAFTAVSLQNSFNQLATKEYEAALLSAKPQDFEHLIARYGQRFPGLQEEAIQKRDSLAYELALIVNNSNELAQFLSKYPNSRQLKEAQKQFNQLLYQERTQDNSEESLAKFIDSFPESPYLTEAWSRLYNLYTQQATVAVLHLFIQKYPAAPQTDQAWKHIYRLYMQPYSVEKLAQFKQEFPAYPFLTDLAEDGELLIKKLYPFLQDGNYGYMDENGKVSISAQYEAASAFNEGLAIVAKRNLYGLINKKNETIISFKYLDITSNANGFILEDSTGFYLLDLQGRFLQKEPLQWEELQQTLIAFNWQESTIDVITDARFERVERNGKVGLNKNGKVILQPKFDDVFFTKESPLLMAKQGRVLNYYDSTGKRLEINGLEWFLTAPELANFSKSGLAIFSKSAKFGLIDTKGKVLIKNLYDAAQPVFCGLWPVQQKGKWGLVAIDNKTVLPFEQQKILPLAPFGFLVERESGLGLIDTTGKWLLQPDFQTIKALEPSYFLVEDKNGLGLYDSSGQVLLSCGFERIVRFDPDVFQLTSSVGLSYYRISDQKIIGLKL
jgi:hypothetical protein